MPSAAVGMRDVLILALGDERVALPVEVVFEVHRAALPARLPNAPAIVEGILNVRGELIPVVNVRRRLGGTDRALRASDHLVVARANGRLVAFAVDQVLELTRIPESEISGATGVLTGTAHLSGIATLPDGIVVVHDLGALLTGEELDALDHALDMAPAS